MIINNKTLSKRWLNTGRKYEDWRDFYQALGSWGYSTNFTYLDKVLNDQNMFLLYFLADDTCDHQYVDNLWHKWEEMEDRKKFAKQALSLGLTLPKRFLNLLKK